MIDINKLVDTYNRQARLYPALITVLPPALLALTWLPALDGAIHAVISFAVACGLLFLLADFARSRGKTLERRLLREWGGWPTTLALRHRDDTLSTDVKLRYHRFLSKQRSIGPLPTAQEELNDPARADDKYAAAVVWLKEQCRGDAFPLVEKENITYGFRRNLAGLKSIGILLCLMTILTPLVRLHLPAPNPNEAVMQTYAGLPTSALAAVSLSIIALVGWLFGVNGRWVRQGGEQYASTLLACCDRLK